MQSILGIDFSAEPCELCLVAAEGGRLQVTARSTVELSVFSDIRRLCTVELAPILSSFKQPSKGGGSLDETATTDESRTLSDNTRDALDKLSAALKALNGEWTSSVVILPAHDHVSLNLNLPFNDTKMLERVIDMEVQDVVPFELNEFSVQPTALGHYARGDTSLSAEADPPYDIHVGLLPRTFVANVLALCKAVGVEPNVMTVPSSAVASVFHLGPTYFTSNSAVILQRADQYAIAVLVNGQVRVEKTLRASELLPASPHAEPSAERRPVYTALKLLLAASERRYGTKVEKLFFLGTDTSDPLLQQVLGRPVEPLSTGDFLTNADGSVSIAALSTVFARDNGAPAALSNFRSREFSFTPKLAEFIRALAGARRQLINAVLSVVVLTAGVFLAREYNLARSREKLVEQIRTVIPDFDPGEADVRAALIRAEAKLSDELGVLGPIAKVTPLDALLEIMRLLPTDNGVTITSIKVTSKRNAQITGITPQLSTIETVKEALSKGRGDVFSKVTAAPGAPSGSRYNFTVELTLSQ
jgi:hypothetical protein